VNRYRLIQVSVPQFVVQVLGAIDRWILVRAVQALDRDVMVRVHEKSDRPSDLLTSDFVIRYQDAMTLKRPTTVKLRVNHDYPHYQNHK